MLFFYPNKPLLIPIESPIVNEKSDDTNFWAEVKKNGSRLALRKDKTEATRHQSFNGFVFWNREKSVLKYTPSETLLEELYSFDIPEGTHIDAELLHQKTKHIKHLIYVYDIYWYKGKQVFETLEVRRKMIEDIFGGQYKHFVLSKTYQTNFRDLFYKVINEPENEGLVLKSKKGTIEWNLKSSPEVWWQLKIRKSSKNYQF